MSDKITRNTPYDDLPELMRPYEVQVWLGISRTAIYDLLRRDELPSRRFGRQLFIPKTALRPEAK
jgi:excisionase family DNA binding protein